MRIKIRHETSFRYAEPAASALHLLRMTPRPHDSQFVRRWRVAIDADARLDRSEDAYGNVTHLVFVHGPVDSVTITIDGEVDTRNTNGSLKGGVERQPVALYLRETALTRITPALRRFARQTSAGQGGDQLATLHALTRGLHKAITFTARATGAERTAGDAFEAKSGIAEDFTHIMLAASRALGLPSRYVSGYFLRPDHAVQDAGHAWAEVYMNRIGWVGFDPSEGICTTERHVRVAVGCDAREAAPIRGARVGGGEEGLDVAIHVEQGRTMIQDQ
jgi:transglutaminase-like putative cysteine protease